MNDDTIADALNEAARLNLADLDNARFALFLATRLDTTYSADIVRAADRYKRWLDTGQLP